jgi:hypothetical protein
MKKLGLLFGILIVVLTSCKKEKDDIITTNQINNGDKIIEIFLSDGYKDYTLQTSCFYTPELLETKNINGGIYYYYKLEMGKQFVMSNNNMITNVEAVKGKVYGSNTYITTSGSRVMKSIELVTGEFMGGNSLGYNNGVFFDNFDETDGIDLEYNGTVSKYLNITNKHVNEKEYYQIVDVTIIGIDKNGYDFNYGDSINNMTCNAPYTTNYFDYTCDEKGRYKMEYGHTLKLKEPNNLDYSKYYEIKYKVTTINELGIINEFYVPITENLNYNYIIN